MIAEVVSIGTELLLGQITDTNAAYLGKVLAGIGIPVYRRQTVGDNLERVADAIKLALSRSDLLVIIAGLGPTEDDLTREGIAAAIGEDLIFDPDLQAHLDDLFKRRGLTLTKSQSRQAERPPSAKPIPNPNGTAPGLVIEKNGKIIIAIPGPPNEFIPMIDEFAVPYLREKSGGAVIRSRVLRIIGIGEGAAEDAVRDLIHGQNPTVAPLAHPGEVHLRITAVAPSIEEAEKLIEPMDLMIRERLGEAVYGIDEMKLEDVVVSLLRERRQTLSVGESCSGGLLSHRITNIPGASDVFLGGVVAYSNELKMRELGVPESVLIEHGAVCPEVATLMAQGAAKLTGSNWGIGITGIAGPTGGTETKPVGLVYIAIANGATSFIEEHKFIGQRETVKERSAHRALALLRKGILRSECESL